MEGFYREYTGNQQVSRLANRISFKMWFAGEPAPA